MQYEKDDLDEQSIEESVLKVWQRDYSLNDFPRDVFGDVIPLEDNDEDFSVYLEWLADYLFNAPPPSYKMLKMIEYNLGNDKTPGHQILNLAMEANIYDLEISIYDHYAKNPEGIDSTELLPELIKKAEEEHWQKWQYGLEKIPCANFSDIAWRVPLAWILNKVPDKKERIELLKSYFEEYDYWNYK